MTKPPATPPLPKPATAGVSPASPLPRPAGDHQHDHSHKHDDHDHDHDHEHDHGPPPPHADAALVSARGIGVTRDRRAILQGINLDLMPGEIVTLIGPNGAGKTTLVRVMLGLLAPDTGVIKRQDDLVVGYVPQRFDLDRAIPMTVERFLSLGRRRGREAQQAVLDEVGAGELVERQFTELSGGELQRVLIARALLRNPALLVLDEPVRGVDYAGEAELYGLISSLRSDRGIGVLLVSHDLHVVMASSDRVICVNRHICCSGIPEQVAQHPEYARLFGPLAARNFALYRHAHDHKHDLAGEPIIGDVAKTKGKGEGKP